jgi:hypothetical protein
MEWNKLFDRSGLKFYPLTERINRVEIETKKIGFIRILVDG